LKFEKYRKNHMATASAPVVVDLITPPPSPVPPVKSEGKAAVPPLSLGASSSASATAARVDYDSDVQEVAAPVAKRQCVSQAVEADDDDEVEIVGYTGDNPLSDFPHLREHCLCHPFATCDHKLCCKMCFCYVCDKPASECTEWTTSEMHCHAISSNPVWKEARRSHGRELLYGMRGDHRKLARQVYRQMHSTKVKTPLNMAQTQMLAFCVDAEDNGAPTSVFATNRKDTILPSRVRGGIVASQVGMGKTGAMCALMLERPAKTLVVVKPLLVKQWMRQLAMFAPQLKAASLYATAQKKVAEQIQLYDVVVVGSTSTLNSGIADQVERIIVDEAHDILGHTRVSSDALTFLVRSHEYPKVKSRWLVTGTPYSTFADTTFTRMSSFLFRSLVSLSPSATLSDLKAILIRIERDQKIKDAHGNEVVVANIPQLQYCTLECSLSPDEQILYQFAGCIDGWTHRPLTLAGDGDINNTLKERFRYRQMVLGERFQEFHEEANKCIAEQMYCPDDMRLDEFYCVVSRMRHAMSEVVERCKKKSAKYDMVIESIRKQRSADRHYKAIIISQSWQAGEYIYTQLQPNGIRVGVMQRRKGSNMLKMQDMLEEFQQGGICVLVCAYEIVEIGVNLEEACELFFVDTSLDDKQFEQACGRIERFGVRHTELKATCVYVKGTISEKIYKYHNQRRKEDVSQATAAQIFLPDDVHSYSDETIVPRLKMSRMLNDSQFSIHDRAPARVRRIFEDSDIDAAFEEALGGDDDPVEMEENTKDVVWKLSPPAGLDAALYARLVLVDHDNFTIDFAVPELDGTNSVTLTATVVDLPVRKLEHTDNLHMQLVMPGNKITNMKHQIDIAEHGCRTCSLCAFRSTRLTKLTTIGWRSPMLTREKEPLTDVMANRSVSFKGVLSHEMRNNVFYGPATYERMSSEFRAALEQAKQHRPTCNEIHAGALGPRFFEMSPRHAKAYVMVDDNIKVGDTVGFRYNETDYKVFVREMDPAPAPDGGLAWWGLAWWVTAFVQVEGPVSETILVTSSRKVA
jgi:superfamily II DNA or RNA helicase